MKKRQLKKKHKRLLGGLGRIKTKYLRVWYSGGECTPYYGAELNACLQSQGWRGLRHFRTRKPRSYF